MSLPEMDERSAEHLLYVDATLSEMAQLAARGRAAYDADIAVARACQYNVIRLAADSIRSSPTRSTPHGYCSVPTKSRPWLLSEV